MCVVGRGLLREVNRAVRWRVIGIEGYTLEENLQKGTKLRAGISLHYHLKERRAGEWLSKENTEEAYYGMQPAVIRNVASQKH